MFSKHKNRLYLVLERKQSPGYLWSIVLAPADDKVTSGANVLATQWEIVEGPPRYWTFQSHSLDMNRPTNMIARILLNKFADESSVKSHILAVLNEIPIEQDDYDFKSRVWAMNGLEALRAAGLAGYDASKAELEGATADFANEILLGLTRREISINKGTEIPTRDMRWK